MIQKFEIMLHQFTNNKIPHVFLAIVENGKIMCMDICRCCNEEKENPTSLVCVCVCSRICASCFAKYLGLQCLGISHVSLTYEFPVLSRAEFQVSKTLTQIICRPISVLYAHAVKE